MRLNQHAENFVNVALIARTGEYLFERCGHGAKVRGPRRSSGPRPRLTSRGSVISPLRRFGFFLFRFLDLPLILLEEGFLGLFHSGGLFPLNIEYAYNPRMTTNPTKIGPTNGIWVRGESIVAIW